MMRLTCFVYTAFLPLIGFGQVIKDTTWLDRPHFVIHTESATYLYDKAGGGLSSLFDEEGNDWIAFNQTGNDEYPASAAGRFRGMPNFVFRSDDSGAGHPGFEQCVSRKVSDNQILSSSKSGKWQWRWSFSEDHARVEMEKADPEHVYWFLYEGTPGGAYQPASSYWGTDQRGPSYETGNYLEGEKIFGNWQWAYFGEDDTDRVLYLLMPEPDDHPDVYAFLGSSEKGLEAEDGMLVFGFGRRHNALPQMNKVPNIFIVGFYPEKITKKRSHQGFADFLEKKYRLKP